MAVKTVDSRLPGGLSSESAPVLVFDPRKPENFWLTSKITIKIKTVTQAIEFIMVP
jgi:hypothetical protein